MGQGGAKDELTQIGSRRRERTRGRITVAVLLDYMNFLGGTYENHLRDALERQARKRDVNLLFYYGRAISEPGNASKAQNAVFTLIDPSWIDGVVSASSVLSSACGSDALAAFMQQHRELPRCSIGVDLKGTPSLLIDNASGITAVVRHLVEVHGRRQLAFISGPNENPESVARLRAFERELTRRGLEVNQDRILEGRFTGQSGRDAARELLRRKVSFDAIVAANDTMALGAQQQLERSGLRVPEEIPVTGFDDLRPARLASPPLTTVSQPFDELAGAAIDSIVSQASKRPVPERQTFQTHCVVRRSCGCPGTPRSSITPGPERLSPREYLARHRDAIEADLSTDQGSNPESYQRDSDALLRALTRELDGERGAFVSCFVNLLALPTDADRARALQRILGQLRRSMHPASNLALERTWFEALDRLALINGTLQLQHRLRLDTHYLQLVYFGGYITGAFDDASLARVVERHLPSVGVGTALIARFSCGEGERLEPLVAWRNGHTVELSERSYPARQLLPEALRPFHGTRQTLVVFPLSREGMNLGIAVFDYAGVNHYEVLRDQITTALWIANLHGELVERTAEHERSVQEKLATSRRMQSLSLLAGGVAHDLNNTLGPIVALPELICRQLSDEGGCPAVVREDLETIQAASRRASQTIKDLLTLGRQGRAPRTTIDVGSLIHDCLAAEFRRPAEGRPRGAALRVEVPSEPIVVTASEPHLARALTNLVLNAAEATRGGGEVRVKLRRVELTEPLSGYERIDPGSYAVVSVEDTGHGMSADDLNRVFEPFFSRKRLGTQSGSGLGLSIVHGVIKEHAGFVDVQSQLGTGTTFTLYLPTVEREAYSQSLKPPEPRGTARILMVDDDAIQLRTAKRVLTHLGYEVSTLASGQQAEAQITSRDDRGTSGYDLIILDMLLNEERDGLEVLERIREIYPRQRAILVSGHAPSERAERAAGNGVSWLAKPFSVDALAQAVGLALMPDASGRRSVMPNDHTP